MKRPLILPPLLLAVLLGSCDPGYQTDYYFENRSGVTVTVRALVDSADMYVTNALGDTWMFFENPSGITIRPGERRLVHSEGGLGFSCKDGTVDILRHFVLGDSVLLDFGGGVSLLYKYNVWAPNNPYIENNYSFRLTEVSRGSSAGEADYIVGEDDYLRALSARPPLSEAE